MEQTVDAARQYLSFQVAGDDYAIGVLQIHEIIEYADVITRVPQAPPSVRGVLNLRGRVVPVVDLAIRFGLPATVPSRRTCVIIVDVESSGESMMLGLLADAVDQVIDLATDQVLPPPTFGTRVRIEFLLGLGSVGDRFVMLLDLPRLLAEEELRGLLPGRTDLAALQPGTPL